MSGEDDETIVDRIGQWELRKVDGVYLLANLQTEGVLAVPKGDSSAVRGLLAMMEDDIRGELDSAKRDPFPPRDALLEELKRLAKELGNTPTRRDMDVRGEYNAEDYDIKFGRWSDALKEVGMRPHRPQSDEQEPEPPSREELIEELRTLADDLDELPWADDVAKHGQHSVSHYDNEFDTWDDALDAAGLDPDDARLVTNEELLGELRSLAVSVDEDRAPTKKEVGAFGKFSVAMYRERFGSWEDALSLAEVDSQ